MLAISITDPTWLVIGTFVLANDHSFAHLCGNNTI